MESNIETYKKQIEIAKEAQKVINKYKEDNIKEYKKFTKWFHLRPCSDYITIVTTHPERPMRGIGIAKSKIEETIKFLTKCVSDDGEKIEWGKIKNEYNAKKGFENGRKNKEFPYQAEMINSLQNNQELKKIIGVKNLYFIASEVVFARKSESIHRIDVVAHDGIDKVVFFEMKAPENTKDDPIVQVKEYLKLYGKNGEKNEVFEEIMANYPQNSITRIKEYVGYGIVGYSNSLTIKKEMLIECK